ncbi:hypothetical protein VTO42DRAFT_9069 [Malbranchea cinnamomea]
MLRSGSSWFKRPAGVVKDRAMSMVVGNGMPMRQATPTPRTHWGFSSSAIQTTKFSRLIPVTNEPSVDCRNLLLLTRKRCGWDQYRRLLDFKSETSWPQRRSDTKILSLVSKKTASVGSDKKLKNKRLFSHIPSIWAASALTGQISFSCSSWTNEQAAQLLVNL